MKKKITCVIYQCFRIQNKGPFFFNFYPTVLSDYCNIPHCGSLSSVVEVYKEMSVATVAHKHHKSYFTAKKESYLAAQGYWSTYIRILYIMD